MNQNNKRFLFAGIIVASAVVVYFGIKNGADGSMNQGKLTFDYTSWSSQNPSYSNGNLEEQAGNKETDLVLSNSYELQTTNTAAFRTAYNQLPSLLKKHTDNYSVSVVDGSVKTDQRGQIHFKIKLSNNKVLSLYVDNSAKLREE